MDYWLRLAEGQMPNFACGNFPNILRTRGISVLMRFRATVDVQWCKSTEHRVLQHDHFDNFAKKKIGRICLLWRVSMVILSRRQRSSRGSMYNVVDDLVDDMQKGFTPVNHWFVASSGCDLALEKKLTSEWVDFNNNNNGVVSHKNVYTKTKGAFQ